MESWREFAELARTSANSGALDPALPVTVDETVSLGYDLWAGVQTSSGHRRTLEVFEAILRNLHGESVASLYRKVKGKISPRGDELERLLAAIFVESDGEGLPREDAEELARELAALYLHRTPDIVGNSADAWLFASSGRLVHGPDDHTRDETFRELMSNRLQAACDLLETSNPTPLPLTLWVIDVSELWLKNPSPDIAFDIRRELMVLTSALTRALTSKLHPPSEAPSLEFSSKPTIYAPDIRIALSSSGHALGRVDLRNMLAHTSAICLIGHARAEDRGRSKLQIEGNIDGNFFSQALMPATIVDRARLSASGADRAESDRIISKLLIRQVCVGSRVPIEQILDIGEAAGEPADVDILQKLALDPQFYAYSFDQRPGEKISEVIEVLLHGVEMPPAIRIALFALLFGATAKLRKAYDAEACPEGSMGQEMLKLLASNQVEILTVKEFLDLKLWAGINFDEFEEAGEPRKKE